MEPEPTEKPADAPKDSAPPATAAPKGVLADRMGEKLRESARRRRPSRLALGLLALALLGVAAALVTWWLWPRAEPLEYVVTAFDQLAVAGAPLTLRARLEPLNGDSRAMAGRELTFAVQPAAAGAGEGKASTDERALASLNWGEAKPGRSSYVARHVEEGRRREAPGTGRVFVLPQQTDLILVDVASLTEAGEKLGADGGPADAPLLPGAAEALGELAKKRFAIVYLAMRPTRAVHYGRLRDWVERQAARLPDGPVLGQGSVEWRTDEPLRNVKLLLEEFEGKRIVIAADNIALAPFRWDGFWVRQVNAEDGGWKDLGKWLER